MPERTSARWNERIAEGATAITWAAFALAVGATAMSMLGTASIGAPRAETPPWVAFGFDRLTLVLLALVTGVSAMVQSFGRRYLRGEPSQARFVVLTAGLTVACAALVSAATLVTLTAAWVASGLLIIGLAELRPGGVLSRTDRRRLRTAFFVGDGSLVVATVVVSAVVGSVQLQGSAGPTSLAGVAAPWTMVAGVLIVVAACARCALIPFSSWLPATLGAPTPVSALLHAGAVNGGGLLLVRSTPILETWSPSWYLLAGAGAATAVWGVAAMSVSVDVKGSLVRSTSAQMGFMIVTIAAGLPAAAVAHLVAHGLFKASLFLGSGSVVHDVTSQRLLPRAAERSRRQDDVVALFAPAIAIVAVVAIVDRTSFALELDAAKVVLGAFAWATASIALRGWLRRAGGEPSVAAIGTGTVALCTAVYVVGVAVFTAALSPSLATTTGGPGAAAFLPLAIGMVALIVIRTKVPATSRLHRWLYTTLLARTHTSAGATRSAGASRGAGSRTAGDAVPTVRDPAPSPSLSISARTELST